MKKIFKMATLSIIFFSSQSLFSVEEQSIQLSLKKPTHEKTKVPFSAEDTCPLTDKKFADLISEASKENRDYILGAIKTQKKDGSEKVQFVDGNALRNKMDSVERVDPYTSAAPLPSKYKYISNSDVFYLAKQSNQPNFKKIGSELDIIERNHAGTILRRYFEIRDTNMHMGTHEKIILGLTAALLFALGTR